MNRVVKIVSILVVSSFLSMRGLQDAQVLPSAAVKSQKLSDA